MAVIFMIKKKMQRIQNVVENTLPSPNFTPVPFPRKKHKSKLLNLFFFFDLYADIPDDKQKNKDVL